MSSFTAHSSLRLETSYRQILSLSMPISFALLVPQFNYLINSFFLARLGEGYLGAAGITGVYYLIFSVIGYGLNVGLQSLISRRAGQDRIMDIGPLFIQSVYISFAIAALGVVLTYLLAPAILKRSVDAGLYQQSVDFLSIRIWGLPFLYLYQMRNALLVGTNQSRLLIYGTLAETVSNVILDYGLIFGKLGMPRLGFNGAAYAGIAAEAIGMLAVFFIIQWKGIGKRFRLFDRLRFDPQQSWLLLTQSSPLILQFGISIISWEFFFILISHHGRLALDISQFMRLVFGFAGIFIWAFGATAATMVSNIIGQGQRDQVIPLIRKISTLSFGITLPMVLLLLAFPGTALSWVRDDPSFIREGIPVVRIVALALIFMSQGAVFLNAVTGTGNTRVNLGIELLTILIYSVYIYLVLERWRMSITWGWASEWLYWLSMLTMSFLYLRSGRWRAKEI